MSLDCTLIKRLQNHCRQTSEMILMKFDELLMRYDTTAVVSSWGFLTKCSSIFAGHIPGGKLLVKFGVNLSQDDPIVAVSSDKVW